MSFLAADGSWNVSVVDGSTYTGRQAADDSTYVVVAPGSSYVGLHHPCGALWVTVAPTSTLVSNTAPDGSMYVCQNPYNPAGGAQQVTAVSGSLTGGVTGGPYLFYIFA